MDPVSPDPADAEGALVARTPEPRTRPGLHNDLVALGVRPGSTLLVHSSLASLGWVAGGAVTAVHALLDAVGHEGTVVVPTQTGDNSDPARWHRPPVPEAWWETIRSESPAFDPAVTPSRGMGAVAELVRTWPGALRSSHPQTSFAAVGRRAAEVVSVHDLDCRLGERSPLAALERLGAEVLLLGAGWGSCTCFHLAEYRLPGERLEVESCAVLDGAGRRRWVTYEDGAVDADDFEALGQAYEAGRSDEVRTGLVGSARARLFPLPGGVLFAQGWLAAHRGVTGS